MNRFTPGQVVATPGALAAAEASGESLLDYVQRHIVGDWGDISLAGSGECQTAGQRNGDGFFGGWFERVSRTQAEQPPWLAPVFTATPRLEEMFVYDISRQNTAKGELTSLGGTKGLLLIPASRSMWLLHLPRTLGMRIPTFTMGSAIYHFW